MLLWQKRRQRRKQNVKSNFFVLDIIYNPKKTILLKKCEELNINNMNGLEMNTYQAKFALEKVFKETVRCRTIGDMTCTGVWRSNATTVEDIIQEAANNVTSNSASNL